jgi:hypothetical protein
MSHNVGSSAVQNTSGSHLRARAFGRDLARRYADVDSHKANGNGQTAATFSTWFLKLHLAEKPLAALIGFRIMVHAFPQDPCPWTQHLVRQLHTAREHWQQPSLDLCYTRCVETQGYVPYVW